MKQSIRVEGFSYRLRPVTIADAEVIIDIRLQDENRNRFIHKISTDIETQQAWIQEYLLRDNDFYFIVENVFTEKAEGLISIYDIVDQKAEWGRWVIKKESMAAIESVYLIYVAAFEKLHLNELYSRTLVQNEKVVNFHNSIGQKQRAVLKDYVNMDGQVYDVVEQYVTREYFETSMKQTLMLKSLPVFKRNVEVQFGEQLKFHHIGVATDNLFKELTTFYMLGYKLEDEIFVDKLQGIKGGFLSKKNQPTIEVLENYEDSDTVTFFLESNTKMYHLAYKVTDIERVVECLKRCRAKIISGYKKSAYFGKRICFLILVNRLMIELIEE